ncbi:hypothetical protein J4E83_007198 [Alternaria metachromatica]|uniref:uncharacterized protein n=1 Tax=Alternaria metachromatica TaxID=283354 RepID=UPI0020C3DD77|nr:uncharacterized protein J4E83_007198 [Alternaria metachromatica]KAI4614544.1 hypothetical protein J4E83_007198 [Alternaria metachromatica]
MGSMFSSINSSKPSKTDSKPPYDGPNRYPYVRNGQLVPVEANPTIWYERLFEVADCVQHQDKDKVIIFTPICDEDNGFYPDPRSRHGWPIKRLRKAYELLGGPHPRIVRVDEVVRDIELAAAEVGITISGDEVDIGEKWEDVFEFKDGKLSFKVRSD